MSAASLISQPGTFRRLLVAAKPAARRAAIFVAWVCIRLRSQPWPSLPAAATTLVLAPHQDDEVLGCGGLIRRRRDAGETVVVAFITDGSASHPRHPTVSPQALGQLRRQEALAATALLGVPADHVRFLDASDGQLPHLSAAVRDDLVARIAGLIEEIRPVEIFITAAADGSTEHAAANALVRSALTSIPAANLPRVLEYPVWSRWNPRFLRPSLNRARAIHYLPLSPRETALKHAALRQYRTQVAPLPPWTTTMLSGEFLGVFDQPWECFFDFSSPT